MKEKDFTAIANENKKVNATTKNVDMVEVETESAKELTESEKLNAYLASHAVDHYCAALYQDVNEVNDILAECEKESGIYWVYTSPKFDETHTREMWVKSYPSAISLDKLGGVEWFKRPFVIGDARGVKTVVNSYNRYQSELTNAQKRTEKKALNGIDALKILAEQNGMTLADYLKENGYI